MKGETCPEYNWGLNFSSETGGKETKALVFQSGTAKMCYSPKVDDGVHIVFTNFLNTYFQTIFVEETDIKPISH